ncbi:MARVEL domain-containing protein 2, partial [Eudyptula minor]
SPPSSALCQGPLLAGICRLAGAQAATLIFLFLTALLCLAGSLLSLWMWRREVAWKHQEAPGNSTPPPARAKHVTFEDEVVPLGRPSRRVPHTEEGEKS